MSKIFTDLINGTVVFADPTSVQDQLTVNVSRTNSKIGIPVVRTKIGQTYHMRKATSPGCDDACSTVPWVRSYKLEMSHEAADDAVIKANVVKDIDQLIADLRVLQENYLLVGAKPSLALAFPKIT